MEPKSEGRATSDETTQVISTESAMSAVPPPSRDRGTFTTLAGPMPGRIFLFEGDELIFGREEGLGGSIHDGDLSRRHARVRRDGVSFLLEDLGSTNGTWLNGERLDGARLMVDGDRVQMGRTTLLRFHLHDRMEQEAAKSLYNSAVRDPLTQLYNRRYLDERLEGELAHAHRHGEKLSLLLLDADHFKRVNDEHGHAAGDEALRMLAAAMLGVVRAEDLVARYGGEEFCVLARSTDEPAAMVLADRLRATIARLEIPSSDPERAIHISVSVGIVTVAGESAAIDGATLLSSADGALYEAKNAGRNRCRAAV